MKSFDILEALNDIDDDVLLRAETDPPRRHWLPRTVRYAMAACLALVLIVTTLIATDVVALDPQPRWTVREWETGVVYLFKGGTEQMNRRGSYAPTWLPEGYRLERDSGTGESRNMIYADAENPQAVIWFSCEGIPLRGTMRLSTLPEGSYTRQTVEINGMPGDLYEYTDGRTGGILIWIDAEDSMVFLLCFENSDPAAALEMARSVTYTEN